MSALDQKSLRTSDSGQNGQAENQDLPIELATIEWGVPGHFHGRPQ